MNINNNIMLSINMNKQPNSTSFKGYTKQLAQDVLEITGKETKAKIFTNNINYRTFEQIKAICSHPVFRDGVKLHH